MDLILVAISLGLLDCLNPATVATQILLLIRTRTAITSTLFITSTFFTYLIGGLVVYFGLSAAIRRVLSGLEIQRSALLTWAELVVGIALLAAGLWSWFLAPQRKPRKQRTITFANQWGVLLIGTASTLSDLPTAVPYFGFVARLEVAQPSPLVLASLFVLYNVLYILPLLVIHALFVRNEQAILRHAERINLSLNRASKWVLLLVLIAGGTYLVYDAVRALSA